MDSLPTTNLVPYELVLQKRHIHESLLMYNCTSTENKNATRLQTLNKKTQKKNITILIGVSKESFTV